jgi:hypothetical protein
VKIRCAHCKDYHDSIQGVRACSQVLVTTVPASAVRDAQAQMDAKVERDLERLNQRSAERQVNGGFAPYRSQTDWSQVRAQGAQLPNLPHARYAVEIDGVLKFYRVDKPQTGRWSGRTFVKVQASDELHDVRRPDSLLAVFQAILQDPKAAMRRYTAEIGACAICGRTLTHETSRANGFGPICGAKMGY